MKPQPEVSRIEATNELHGYEWRWNGLFHIGPMPVINQLLQGHSPYGNVGDVLWVREEFLETGRGVIYRADFDDDETLDICDGWCPPEEMPREYARDFQRITKVQVERLHDISEEDARAEGCPRCIGITNCGCCDGTCEYMMPQVWYKHLWESLHGLGSWDRNDWVWAITYERLENYEGVGKK